MRTLRADRHIDSVECVTAHVRQSHSSGGLAKGSPLVVGGGWEGSARYLDGARRLIVLGGCTSAGAGSAMVDGWYVGVCGLGMV